MRKMLKKLKKQDGDVIVESTIVLSIVIVFIFFLLMLGFYLFQKMSVYIIANDTAYTVASIYSYNAKDPIEGYISPNDYTDTGNLYRYLVNSITSTFGENKNENKGRWYAYYSLQGYQYLAPKEDPQVTVDIKPVSAFKSQVNVTIKAKYVIPGITDLGYTDNGLQGGYYIYTKN